jgi:hypothetical protein
MTISPRSSDGAASLLKGSVVTGIANAVINGAIQAYLLQDNDGVTLTEGQWAVSLHSVAGKAIVMVSLLAIILTLVGHLQWKGERRPFWPVVAWLSAKHGLLALILVAIPSLLWHHLVGITQVSVGGAVAILAAIAGLVAGATHAMTHCALSRAAAAHLLARRSQ